MTYTGVIASKCFNNVYCSLLSNYFAFRPDLDLGGFFVAANNALEMARLHNEVDIFQIVLELKKIQPTFISNYVSASRNDTVELYQSHNDILTYKFKTCRLIGMINSCIHFCHIQFTVQFLRKMWVKHITGHIQYGNYCFIDARNDEKTVLFIYPTTVQTVGQSI